MKKRCLAGFLAVCVMAGFVLAPTEGNAVYAASETETVLLQEEESSGESVSATEAESVDSENVEDTAATESTEIPESETEEQAVESEETEETEVESTEILEAEIWEQAAENTEVTETEREFPTGGLLQPEVYSVTEIDESDIFEYEENSQLKRSAVYNYEWDKYSNNYFYNQMSDDAKAFWDALDAMCLEYLTTNKSISYDNTYSGYYTEFVQSPSLSTDEEEEVFSIFRYSNPQYYFLKNGWLSGTMGRATVLSIAVYPSFANGNDRANATAAVKAQVDSWQTQINACSTDEEKVKLIHDLIIQKVEYNHAIYEDPNFDEDTAYSQTAYSVFCTDLTVCAGYSQAYEMMCNGSGIDAVAVTSLDHEWNKVRVNDSWYNVDCTWDDAGNGSPIYYDFFARNDAYYDSAQQASSHAEETYWEKYLPLCTLDSTSTAQAAGTFPTITDTTVAPQIKALTDSEGDCEVTITSSTPGAEIYYTLDGTTPEASATRCIKYKDSFYVTSATTINAIAVCNGYWDSTVVSATVQPSKKITITFKGNGSTSGSMSKQTAYTNSTFTLKKNAFKKSGYVFAGWNTKANGKGTSYSNKQKVSNLTGSITLYAQWTLPSYKITYKLNGGTNNKKNPTTYKKTTKTITLKKPTRKGYTFKGWYLDKNFKNKVTTIKKGSTGNKTLYAKWEANKYTIKFNGNGSTSGKMSALTGRKYGQSYKLTANKFKKKGYTFVGWNTKKNGTGKSYTNKQSIKNLTSKNGGTVTLYAQWKK